MGPHEPVLRIQSGDSVRTTTIDSLGMDENLTHKGLRPNPMTGPFYIEDAEPGDTLAVVFDHLSPNRNTGWSSNILSAQVVDLVTAVQLPQREFIDWDLDLSGGKARLSKSQSPLNNLTLDILPFLGCFGVSPARGEMINTSSSGAHGGNMDYRGFRVGTTAYFPVFEEGALFFLGDGHATQGDGEIIGTGIETSFEVSFTVQLIKGKTISWPRGEDDEYIFTIGNARPLELALQHATAEMLQWLKQDYGLDTNSASILMGQCVEYDVGNVYNPTYTMVCKIRKSILREL